MANIFSLLASLLVLTTSVKIQKQLDLNFTLESIQYDSQSDVYWLSNDVQQTVVAFEPGSLRRAGMTLADDGENGPYNNDSYLQIPTANFRYPNSNTLYVNAALTGHVLAFDIETGDMVYDIYLGENQFPNGMCYNPANDRIYVTDTGLSFIDYSLTGNQQIFELTPELNITRVFLSGDENIYPNGCDFLDDALYVCQTNYVTSGAPIYKYSNLSDSNITDILASRSEVGDWSKYGVRADGLKFDRKNNLYVTSWGPDDDNSTNPGFIGVLREGLENFTIYIKDLNSPADIGYDSKRDLILIPAFSQPTGSVTIVKALSHSSSSSNNSVVTSAWFISVMVIVSVVVVAILLVILYSFKDVLCGEKQRRDSQYEAFHNDGDRL